MTLDDFDAFSEVMLGFAEVKAKELSKRALKLYFRAMQDWSLEEFRAAAVHLLKHHPFPTVPTPADFEQLRKAGESTAAEAWAIVLSGAPLPPGSRMARAAETLGGQQAIRHQDVEKSLPFTRNKFIEVYEGLTKVDPVRDSVPQIAVHGARKALSAPTNIASLLPAELTRRSPPQSASVALPAPAVAAAALKVALTPPKSAREKILKLLTLGWEDDAIAKVAGESVDVVRQVRAEQERAA
ncbi:MAG TPA: hypothetical protein VGD45_20460 [Steroidobacter sp.]|uniref:hypothetical protein n=1 Tax=Steroidobacter sp. TaxID=1978227 RepID=UPI002ED7D156